MPEIANTAQFLMSPSSLGLVAVGSFLGIAVGAIPGLTGAMLISLALPLTFAMDGNQALILLVSMYVGSVSGGLVSATLMRIPGTPASMMTTLDGYPMAQRGQASRALGLGIHASLVGGMISWMFLVALSAPMAELSTRFGPFEFFALVMMSLVLIAALSGDSLPRGLLSGMLGVLIALPGYSPATGKSRLTGGMTQLDDGFKLLPVLIGLFAVHQVIREIGKPPGAAPMLPSDSGRVWLPLSAWPRHGWNLLRSSIIGTWIGILPGVGANIGSMIAYAAAKNASRTPEEFGSGSEEGIVASESANNATVGGALIPLVAMGIPGSVIDAILLGALVIHGIQPGPLLMQQNPQAVYTTMGTLLMANVTVYVMMLLSAKHLVRVARIPQWVLMPTILVFCVLGSYALANRMFDVWVMLGFGVLGSILERLRIPPAPLVIGFVLAPLAEEHLCAGLMQSGGSYLPLVQRPMALLFCVLAVILLVWTIYRRKQRPSIQSLA